MLLLWDVDLAGTAWRLPSLRYHPRPTTVHSLGGRLQRLADLDNVVRSGSHLPLGSSGPATPVVGEAADHALTLRLSAALPLGV